MTNWPGHPFLYPPRRSGLDASRNALVAVLQRYVLRQQDDRPTADAIIDAYAAPLAGTAKP